MTRYYGYEVHATTMDGEDVYFGTYEEEIIAINFAKYLQDSITLFSEKSIKNFSFATVEVIEAYWEDDGEEIHEDYKTVFSYETFRKKMENAYD